MKKTSGGRAATAAASAIAALMLTSCGSPSLTMGGSELKVSGDAVSGIESSWEAHRQTQPESNLGPDAGCFIEAAGEEMTGAAFCGPVRYLGEDRTGWDRIRLELMDRDGRTELVPGGTFTVGPLSQDTELIRHDSRSADRSAEVQEPDAPATAEALTVFATDEVLPADSAELSVALPEGFLSVTAAAERERAGSAADRTAAPKGHRMASVSFDAKDLDRSPERGAAELSFIVDGKDYPFDGQREGGTVSIAVPEGADVDFGVTFDGVTQRVSVPDMLLDAGDASALYAPKWNSAVLEDKVTSSAQWVNAHGNRSAHTPGLDLGWAGKDQVWVKAMVTLTSLDGIAHKKSDGMKLVSAVMTDADGNELETAGTNLFYWGSQMAWTLEAFYAAPADTGETIWNVTLEDNHGNRHVSGPLTLGAEK